jgi:hypothetical protein
MALFVTTVESVAAISASAPSGSTANGLFANLELTTAATLKLRRLEIGVRAGATAPVSQNMTVAIVRTTAVGTVTSHNTPGKMDPNSANSNAQVDTGWSTVPTATWTAPYLFEISFNTQAGDEVLWQYTDEMIAQGSGNGLAFINVGNALPASHLYTLSLTWEE